MWSFLNIFYLRRFKSIANKAAEVPSPKTLSIFPFFINLETCITVFVLLLGFVDTNVRVKRSTFQTLVVDIYKFRLDIYKYRLTKIQLNN